MTRTDSNEAAMTTDTPMLKPSEVARMLNLTPKTVRVYAADPKIGPMLGAVRIGTRWRFRRDIIMRMVNGRTEAAQPNTT